MHAFEIDAFVARTGCAVACTSHACIVENVGPFTQPDPIGLAGGLNLYGYAGGDPINFSDPFGLDCMGPDGRRVPCSAVGAMAGTTAGTAAGVLFSGACTVGTSGLCAAGAPVIVPFFATGGAALGGLAGEVADNSDALVAWARKTARNLRTLILGAGLALSTSERVPATPTNPCGDKPPAEQTDCQNDNSKRGRDSTTAAPRPDSP
jgi:hypothetical protein